MSCHPTFRHLPKLQACLQSNDVNYRIAVGETIALLVELGRDVDEVNRSQTLEAVAKTQLYDVKFTWAMMLMVFAAIRGGGQWKPVSVSEESGNRRQQASSQERPTETALHLQRGSALYRGAFEGWNVATSLNNRSFWKISITFWTSACSPAERGLHRGDNQVWSGERLHRQLDEEEDLQRLQRDHGVWSEASPAGQLCVIE